MKELLRKIFKRPDHTMADAVNEARLMDAERNLDDLKFRARVATEALNARHSRNHWTDSISQMIKEGGHHA